MIHTTKPILLTKQMSVWRCRFFRFSRVDFGINTGTTVTGVDLECAVFLFSFPMEEPNISFSFTTSWGVMGQPCRTSVIFCRRRSLGNRSVVWRRWARSACFTSRFVKVVLLPSTVAILIATAWSGFRRVRNWEAYRPCSVCLKNLFRSHGRWSMNPSLPSLFYVTLKRFDTLPRERMFAAAPEANQTFSHPARCPTFLISLYPAFHRILI